jgi:regulator of RNase E activity RraA
MDDLFERAGGLATSTLANALDEVGLHDRVIAAVRPVAPGFRFAGPAVTVKEITGPVGSFPPDAFKVGEMIDAAGPGDVLVVDAGGAPVSTFGGMASFAAKRKGIAGLVVDGGVRDLEEIVAFGFPVFARHLIPTTGRTRLQVKAIGVPVRIDGVEVAPGDMVVGDGTGIVCLPGRHADEIVAIAERLAADDAAALKDLEAGLSFKEAMAKYRKI